MGRRAGMYEKVIKPTADRMVALVLLLLLSPVLLLLILLLATVQRGRIFFVHKRPGLHGKPFTFYKFSTLKDDIDDRGRRLTETERLGPVGFIMRRTSLDELPQLLNIIKGDMSFVGPRPLLMEYLPLYSPRQMRRHEVRPGLTGHAQVNGRNLLNWEKRFEYDLYYVGNISFLLDMKILLKTVQLVISGKGVSGASAVLMDNFTGNPSEHNTSGHLISRK